MGIYERFFNEIASQLDLTSTEEETIIKSYESVGEFLRNSNFLSAYLPYVFPQGSMKIGTTVKPLKRDDYDVDLVCELTKNINDLSPKDVKKLVGKALKCGKYADQLEEEHGRCWTLQYSANPPYHLDILPGLTNVGGRINATKRDNSGKYDWLRTNPRGFANWFLGLYKRKQIFDENNGVESLDVYGTRNPLQRAVQLIKRHRDVYFQNRKEDGPASIIITALTGLSYKGETTIEDILRNGPILWASFIKISNGKYYIQIPPLTDDNYADKWNGEDKKAAALFFEWHAKLLSDLDKLFSQREFDSFLQIARDMFSESSVDKTLNKNISIKSTLLDSFGKRLPMALDVTHPLFKHALSIKTDKHDYIPRGNTTIKIDGRVFATKEDRDSNREDKCLNSFDCNSMLLKKNLFIRFSAMIINCPKRYCLRWQVTNTGMEAKRAGNINLRGGFENSENYMPRIKYEHTSYAGTHFVQAFLIDSNTDNCIAKSNILTINIGGDL